MLIKKYLISIILLVGININSLCLEDNSRDSLLSLIKYNVQDTTTVNAYFDLSWVIRKSFPDSATNLALDGIAIAKKINFLKGEANLYKCIGSTQWNRGLYNDAIESYKKALEKYTELTKSTNSKLIIEGKKGIANCYNGLGLILFNMGKYTQSLEYFQTSLNQQIELGNKEGIGNCYNNIGLVHWKQDNYTRAIDYYQEAINVYTESGNYARLSHGYNNIAIIYKEQKKYADAIEYYQKSLGISKDIDDKKTIAANLNNIGVLYEEIHNYISANKYYQDALKIKIEIDDKNGIASTYGNLASLNNVLANNTNDLTIKKQNLTKAIQYANQCLQIANEIGALYRQMDAHAFLSESYEGLGLLELSLKHHKLYASLKDSLFNQDRTKQIEEAEAKFNAAQKQQQIENQEAEIERQKLYRNSLIALSVLTFILFLLIFNRYKLRQKTNKVLKEKNIELEKLSIVASETDNAVTICDSDGKMEWANDALFKLFGYTLEDRKKLHGETVAEASTNPEINNILIEVQKRKESIVYESTIKTKKGELKSLQTTLTPIIDDNGNILKYIFIDTDITRVKQAEKEILQKKEEILSQKEELENHRLHLEKLVKERTKDLELAKLKAEESDRLKSSFLTNMSHEIRTPMNAIIGFSNMLGENNLDTSTKGNLISEISTHSYSLLNLIENILEIARLDTGQIKVKKVNFDLNNALNDIYNKFYDIIKLKNIEFILGIPNKNIIVFSDSYRITQIFNNLIDNAIKFTEKGKIEIGYSVVRNSIEFFVKDTGIGLSTSQQNLIFERFTKVEEDKKKLYRGAGLGLAISKNIVKLLNGDIWVESEPGMGAQFYFTVPYHEETKLEEVKPEHVGNIDETFNWQNKTILIAEDEVSNYRYFEMLLRKTNANLIWVENGKEAYRKCKENKVNLIIMDIKMPIMDGIEATKMIKKEFPVLPIISVSAYSNKDDIELSKEAGCISHISKPLQKSELLNTINKYL